MSNVTHINEKEVEGHLNNLWGRAIEIGMMTQVHPIFFAFSMGEKGVNIFMVPLHLVMSEERKDDVSHIMQAVIKETGAFATFFITESWMRVEKNAKDVSEVQVKDHPDSKEYITGFFETAFSQKIYMAEVKNVDGNRVIGDTKISDTDMSGRFAGLLKKPDGMVN